MRLYYVLIVCVVAAFKMYAFACHHGLAFIRADGRKAHLYQDPLSAASNYNVLPWCAGASVSSVCTSCVAGKYSPAAGTYLSEPLYIKLLALETSV